MVFLVFSFFLFYRSLEGEFLLRFQAEPLNQDPNFEKYVVRYQKKSAAGINELLHKLNGFAAAKNSLINQELTNLRTLIMQARAASVVLSPKESTLKLKEARQQYAASLEASMDQTRERIKRIRSGELDAELPTFKSLPAVEIKGIIIEEVPNEDDLIDLMEP